jgi:hypothetical protein
MASSGYGSLVTGGYEKGKFKLNLPKSVDEEYLSPMSIFDMLGGFTVSNPDAMHAMVAVQALDEDGEFLGAFAPMDMNKQSLAFYVYCDASCSVKGSIEEEAQGMNVELSYNCSFKKGWNFMYISVKESNTEASVSCTTSKLSGANYKWTFVDKDGDF